jgi:hypothetical protein
MFEYLFIFFKKIIQSTRAQATSLFLKMEGMVENYCICVLGTPKRNGPLLKGKGD